MTLTISSLRGLKLFCLVPKVFLRKNMLPALALLSFVSASGQFKDSYNVGDPLDSYLPVHAYVPGCPPKPEAIILGVVKAAEVLKKLGKDKPADPPEVE